MRQLTAAALAKIAESYGTEPINIVEIDWEPGVPAAYADKRLTVGNVTIPGSILRLSNLDSVLDVFRANTSQAIDMTIDDSDGTIKNFIDTKDVHQIQVRVYQFFDGMALSDKFLVFAGRLNSPLRWSEATRTFSFGVLSQIEDKEFGFSPEEGEIPGLPSGLIGRPWPSIFGTVLDVPAVNIGQSVTGSTLCGVGYVAGKDAYLDADVGGFDCGFGTSMAMMSAQISFLNIAGAAFGFAVGGPAQERANALREQANSIRQQQAQLVAQKQNQINCALEENASKFAAAEEQGEGCNPLRVLGGEDFPQDTVITIEVGGLTLTGKMVDQDFTIHTRSNIEIDAQVEQAQEDAVSFSNCIRPEDNPPPPSFFNFEMDTPQGVIRRRGFIVCNPPSIQGRRYPEGTTPLRSKFVEAGARVSIVSGQEITYVASITPGTVLDVKARKRFEGEERLVSVPPEYYTVETRDFGTVTATIIKMDRTLTSRDDEGWADDIFVTFRSDIGPNTVDVLEYIINNYTDLSFDAASFASVKTDLTPFPSHFAILDRRNTLDLIKDIAFQARCAVYVSNGVFFLKYLPADPVSNKTIGLSDIEVGSIELTSTNTEDIITKMNVLYRISYAEEPRRIILRNNVSRYGTREETFDWFIYSNADIAYHAATFWLIRLSNMWKRLRFRGFLNLLELETFDTVTMSDPNYMATGDIKSVVHVADYDSETKTITFEVEAPVSMGFLEQHPLYWPKDKTLTYPTDFDTAPGGGGIGANAVGTLPGNNLDGTPFEDIPPQTVIIGGPNGVFGAQSDLGDRTPGDVGFVAGEVVVETSFVDVDNTPAPELDLSLTQVGELDTPDLSQIPDPTVIDIQTTLIGDSNNPGKFGFLKDFIDGIDNSKLILRTDAEWTDGTDQGTFDFKYDAEDSEWGAGTAFFEDE